MADELFNQADLNQDQRLDLNEFRNLIAQNLGPGAGASIYSGNVLDGGQYSGSSYESASSGTYGDISSSGGAGGYGGSGGAGGYGGSGVTGGYGGSGGAGGYGGSGVTGGYGGIADLGASNIAGIDNEGGNASYSSYEQSSYSSSTGGGAGEFNASAAATGNLGGTAAGISASSSSFEASSTQQQIQQYATNAQGLFQDPNPQIIRRPAQGGQLTYTQNIKIRFLQPPAIPPPGPLIIKEVRPPQPPPPPPLVVRQRAPSLPQPPPLILREKPPQIPAAVGAQTVIRKLPAIPVPPRSVIIERLPPAPPKPRDIIIERWIPYGAMAKRKTIVQRAEAAQAYEKPRNVIIQYEAPQVRVIRQFQRLGVTPENPQAYVQRYGASLLDAQTLLQQAHAAGVVEDISPPANLTTTAGGSSSYAEFTNATSGLQATGDASSSTFESSGYAGQQGSSGFSGFESAQGGGGGGGGFASSYESSSFSSQGGAALGDGGAQGYQSYIASSGSNSDLANVAFNAADLNKDGSIDPNEFQHFITSQHQ